MNTKQTILWCVKCQSRTLHTILENDRPSCDQCAHVDDEGITPEAWAEALREKKNNPL